MTDETHDQNQGLETPDTAPSRRRIVGLAVVMYALVACIGYIFIYQLGAAVNLDSDAETGSAEPVGAASAFPRAVYLAPAADRLLIPEQVRLANLEVVTDQIELATALGNNPTFQVIFVDPRLADAGDLAWLRGFYNSGKTLVGLNVSHTSFSAALGLTPAVSDLDDRVVRDSLLAISLHRQRDGTPVELAAAYDQFDQMLTIVHDLAVR